MTTLEEWFNRFTDAKGETPTAIVFGWDEYDEDRAEEWGAPKGLTDWADVPTAILTRSFDAGWGGNESPNFCAWSAHWVIFSDNYDGAESVCWVPRHPIAHDPIRPGGG